MPHGIPLGDPDRCIRDSYISLAMFERLPCDLKGIYISLCAGALIGVHYRPKRHRYTIDGKPMPRRTIDRLVYFGVIDEGEL